MSNTVSLDLRYNASLAIKIDQGVACFPSILGIANLDIGYTLEINQITKTIGNGLEFTPNNNGIIIQITSEDFLPGTYTGYLISDSRIAGTYLKIKIEINCYECNC